MPFSSKAHTALFSASRRRTSFAHAAQETEVLASDSGPLHHAGMSPSASTSWINPFGRASFSVDDDSTDIAPGSSTSSRRPSAATIISTLLHGVGVGGGGGVREGSSSTVRLSQDGYTSGSEEAVSSSNGSSSRAAASAALAASPPAAAQYGRRPSAIFKVWKARRGSQSTNSSSPSSMQAPPAPLNASTPALGGSSSSSSGGGGARFAQGRRKSSALTRVLQPSALRTSNIISARVDEHHSLASSDDPAAARRRSLSIVCRGERESDEFDRAAVYEQPSGVPSSSAAGMVTAAMAIRDTWLYGEHQWTTDGRKGSVSALATSPTQSDSLFSAMGSKSFSFPATAAVGLDEEQSQQQHRQRLREREHSAHQPLSCKGGDTVSVVSLSLTEEIALYTSDVQAVEYNASRARTNAKPSRCQPRSNGLPVARRDTTTATTTTALTNTAAGAGAFAWNLPEWTSPARQARGSRAGSARLPALSPAPAVMIADPFSRITMFGTQQPQAEAEVEATDQEAALGGASMQRVESGSVDPMLPPHPVYSPALHTPGSENASDGHGTRLHPPLRRASAFEAAAAAVAWAEPQWNAASPFRPADTSPAYPTATHPASVAATSSYHSADDQSPTAPNFPAAAAQACVVELTGGDFGGRKRATTYYDASPLPIVEEVPSSLTTRLSTPRSPRSFGQSETSFEMHRRHERRTSYSLPRPPPGYEPADSAAPPPTAPAAVAYDFDTDDAEEQQAHNAPTPRLVGLEFGEASASPMSSNFEPETPGNVVATFAELQHGVAREKAKVAREEEGEDLHAQFCSVLLLDLGNGTAIPLGASPGVEPRPDPFTLLAC